MSRSTDPEPTLEQRTIAAHRLYLASPMRIEVLDEAGNASIGASTAAEAQHRVQFGILNALPGELGYVPKGLATRSDLAMALTGEAAPSDEVHR